MKKYLTVSILALAGLFEATAFASAADPIYEGEQTVYRQKRSYDTAYVEGRGEVCDDLLIQYRHPYDPHSEIVRVCHAPIF